MSEEAVKDDLSALAWVHGELRRSLEAAHKALRRYLKEAEAASGSDVDAVDPAVLRTARNQLHQGVGALELVGLPAVADVLRASEAAVQRMVARPVLVDGKSVETIEKVSFALLDFLGRQLAGKPVSPLLLFPQYRAALQLAGVDRVHPADLWKIDWQWRELPPDPLATPRNADDSAREAMETEVLALMRQSGGDGQRAALARMSDLCADLGAGARVTSSDAPHVATFWQLAAAVFEAQSSGLLVQDAYSKRIASRLMAQLRMRVKGNNEISDRLTQDLLFFCGRAQAPSALASAPRLAAVRKAWQLPAQPAPDYENARLGRFDPAVLALARKRVAAVKDSWSGVAGGELHRLTGLGDQFTLVGESLQKLFPAGEVLANALQTAVTQTVAAAAAPPPTLAMEVATGILYLDASLEDAEFDHPELEARVQRLAQRIDDVRIGAAPQPLDAWMEELYRRVSDRQTMGSVVQELRASLSEVEKQIDQYFRDPAQRQLLIPVPAQLSAMRGVLSVLGMDQASAAVLRMRDDVDALAQTEVDPHQAIQAGTFDRLADNLGALSFLIDMLSVQPQLAKSLFRFDPETGNFSAVMQQSERVSAFAAFDEAPQATPSAAASPLLDQLRAVAQAAAQPEVGDAALAGRLEPLVHQAQAADQPELARLLGAAQRTLAGDADAQARQQVREELVQAVGALAPPAAPEVPPTAPVPPVRPVAPGGTGLEDDEEMLEIFVEEAREVIADALTALERLADVPDNVTDMTAVRRAFHTLKGSARMVGLRDFGDAGWACEQLYNARLAAAPRMDNSLRAFTVETLSYLASWIEAIAAHRDLGHNTAAVVQAAESLRVDGVRRPIVAPQAPAAPQAEAVPEPAFELSFEPEPEPGLPTGLHDASVPEPAAEPEGAHAALDARGAHDASAAAPPLEAHAPIEAGGAESAGTAGKAPSEPEFLGLPDLDLDLLEEFDTAQAGPAAAQPLTLRVPDLPSADDLDLRPAAPPLPELSFDMDLADLDGPAEVPELEAGSAPGPAAAPAPATFPAPAASEGLSYLPPAFPFETVVESVIEPAVEPVSKAPTETEPAVAPIPEAEALEIDLADLQDVFAAASTPFAPAGPAVEAVAPDLLLDLSGPPPTAGPAVEPTLEGASADATWVHAELHTPHPPLPAFELEPQPRPAPVSDHGSGPEPEPATEPATEPVPELVPESVSESVSEPVPQPASAEFDDSEQVKVIGPLRISIPLFNIYLNEADELSRRLQTELAEWVLEHERHPVPDSSVALAHSLAGSSATVGYAELSTLARGLEHALMHSHAQGPGRHGDAVLFQEAADEIRRLLHQFAAGFLPPVQPQLVERLAASERQPPVAPAPVPVDSTPQAEGPVDQVDAELFPIFEEEADELLPQLQQRLRGWLDDPAAPDGAMACMRTLHTLKGGARLAGAMGLGELAHGLETEIEHLVARGQVEASDLEPLLLRGDAMNAAFEALRRVVRKAPAAPLQGMRATAGPALKPAAEPAAEPTAQGAEAALDAAKPEPARDASEPATHEPTSANGQVPADAPLELVAPLDAGALVGTVNGDGVDTEAAAEAATARAPAAPVAIEWQRFAAGAPDALEASPVERPAAGGAVVRVRAGLLDRLVNQAGEVSITRARIDSDVRQMQAQLGELTDSLERMRRQLRDIELQAETQISTRIEAAKAASQAFDPLEMDRFTRFQELTRFMAESVNDVATLQRSLQRTLQSTEDELAAQTRLTRELQDDLLRTRMIEFESLAERLHRTVRQAARDTAKQVRLEIVGGAIEIDRGVLERMAGSFEHLLRNSVAHGIETPDERVRAGKDMSGLVTVTVAQSGNEVAVDFADDGAGFDRARIVRRAVERGLLAPGAEPGEAELARLLFTAGFSTAESVTELAGRGVGLDVVKAEVDGMGGRIETSSEGGRGTRFRLLLPLTTAVTQVVMLRCGDLQVAVPSTLVEIVRRVPSAEVERAYEQASLDYGGEVVPFFWLGALLQSGARGDVLGRTQTLVVIRSASQRVALHVDEVPGNQEVVVKNVGPQLARLPGLAGVTLLPSGTVALIYNPVALASLYGEAARRQMQLAASPAAARPAEPQAAVLPRAAMVMVVDDSLTVRRVTQRLLVREGYRVVTAKDGLEALERLAEERPAVLLSDIEMPRMDGFDLVRNVRSDPALAGLPVVMITSRIAQKHRDYATELGVDHYLGKPYAEDELLALVARYAGADIPA